MPRLILILALGLMSAVWLAAAGPLERPAQHAGAAHSSDAPPVAKILPGIVETHGHRRTDNYYWLGDEDDPDTLAYLAAENAYAERRLAPLAGLIAEIDGELRARADGPGLSPEFSDGVYAYRLRIAAGARFHQVMRRRLNGSGPDELVLDIETLAAGHTQYELANLTGSPDDKRVAFAVDFTGERSHRIYLRDLATGAVTDTGIADAAADLVFSADSQWLFYIRVEEDTLRSFQLWRHRIGTLAAQDVLVHEEYDPAFELRVSRSKSGRFILLKAEHAQTTEIHTLRADQPLGAFAVMEPRQRGVIYEADHIAETFYIRTNRGAPDFRLVRAPEAAPQAPSWTQIVAESPGRSLVGFELFDTFVALLDEHDAVQSARVVRFADMRESPVRFPAELGVAEIDFAQGIANRDPNATVLQLRFSGPLHPYAAYTFDPVTGRLSLRQKSRTWRWFDPAAYAVERFDATAPDGETVPVTLMFRKDRLRPGGNPTLVTGYGAYSESTLPEFPDEWVSLIDRGFVYAWAHVRGGNEKGRRWYDQGRMQHKRNSFTDFIAVTEALIARGRADPRRVFAQGGSAGGLLVAAAADLRPDLYAGIVAEVPFVDVVTTMSDATVPLTTLEYEEWGDPAVKEHYETMASYSPYDNVTARDYPAMFVTAALYDTQVGYQEPAKWVARLRATKTDANELLLVTDMDAGHTGLAGRFGSSRANAQIMAWLIGQASRPR